MRLVAAGIRSTEYGYTKICTIKKQGAKIPLLKVLAVKGLLSRSPLQGLGQSPKVLGQSPKAFRTPPTHIIHKREEAGEENDMQKAD